jgi:hypothetical protein
MTDHDQIRRWAAVRREEPACVKAGGDKRDTGMLRFEFRGRVDEPVERISWEQWLKAFDDQELALRVEEDRPGGVFSRTYEHSAGHARGSAARAIRRRSTRTPSRGSVTRCAASSSTTAVMSP